MKYKNKGAQDKQIYRRRYINSRPSEAVVSWKSHIILSPCLFSVLALSGFRRKAINK